MDTSGAANDRLDQVLGELASLREENQRLAARVEALDGGAGETGAARSTPRRDRLPRGRNGSTPPHTDGAKDQVSRRGMLKVASATALGAAGAAVVGAAPAGANSGDPVLAGEITLADAGTQVKWNGSSGFTGVLLLGNDTNFLDVGALYPAAAGGWAGGGAAGVANGVFGYTQASAGNGVVGVSTTGAGVKAVGDAGRGVVASGSTAQLQLTPGTGSHPASGGAGDLFEDNTDTLWLALGGTSWRKLGGPTTAGQLHVLPSPVRVYDSRTKDGPLAGGSERAVSLALGTDGKTPAVPDGAIAALFTLTVTNTGSAGFLAAFSNAVAWPGTSNINWFLANSIAATSVTSAVDSAAKVKLHCGGTQTNFLIDVTGYYQ